MLSRLARAVPRVVSSSSSTAAAVRASAISLPPRAVVTASGMRCVAMRGMSSSTKVYDVLAAAEASIPFHDALRVSPHTLNNKTLREEADALANGLAEYGAEPGCRLLVCVEGGGTHAVVQLAASKLGLGVAFVDAGVDEETFKESIRSVEPWAIIFAAGPHNALAHMVQRVFPDTSEALWNRSIEPSEEFPSVEVLVCTSLEHFSGCFRFVDCLVYGHDSLFEVEQAQPCPDPYLYQIADDGSVTSEVSESQALEWAKTAAKALNLKAGDRVLTVPPLVNSGVFVASTLAPLVAGAMAILPRSNSEAAIQEALDGPIPNVIVGTSKGLDAVRAAVAAQPDLLKGARYVDVSSLNIDS